MVHQCFLDILGATQRVGSYTRIRNPPEALPLFVALVDDHVCGTAGASAQRPSRDDDGSMAAARPHDADTYFYYMLSAAQRQSLGRKLMRAMSQPSGRSAWGRPKSWATVENRSRRFHEQLAGKEFARRAEVVAGADLDGIAYA
ncbi:Acyl-CoA N-acyltransferase [Akanthomyces lecanii RCEF 1005]|uniref:Acyl-CoA N-acyltransferase n=1 Tax=Akanthomyces lecanii RCEF 1005 TaxID=1081108 RepID=A0A168J083_CORDF|nr:Acyl-CoA N-acyltransferase [Akanthomyces lecanii RCEF 1005]